MGVIENYGPKAIKYLMIFFNLLFFILGIVVLGFGIYARIKQADYNAALVIINASGASWESFGTICIMVGVFIALLGGSGWLGAWRENRGLLILFSVLVGLVFLLEVTAGGLAYHYRGTLNDKLESNMNTTLRQAVQDPINHTTIVSSWHTVQRTFKCCGIEKNGTADYLAVGGTPPLSCYKGGATANPLFVDGCKSKLFNIFSDHWKQWAGGVVGIAIVQLLSILFALLLVREIGRARYKLV